MTQGGQGSELLPPAAVAEPPEAWENGFEPRGEAEGCSGVAGEPCDLRSGSSAAPFLDTVIYGGS